jgi:hypothetical protein
LSAGKTAQDARLKDIIISPEFGEGLEAVRGVAQMAGRSTWPTIT